MITDAPAATMSDEDLYREMRAIRAERARQARADEARLRTRVTSDDVQQIRYRCSTAYVAFALAARDSGRDLCEDRKDSLARDAWSAAAFSVLGWSRFECLSARQLDRHCDPARIRRDARTDAARYARVGQDADYYRGTDAYRRQAECYRP